MSTTLLTKMTNWTLVRTACLAYAVLCVLDLTLAPFVPAPVFTIINGSFLLVSLLLVLIAVCQILDGREQDQRACWDAREAEFQARLAEVRRAQDTEAQAAYDAWLAANRHLLDHDDEYDPWTAWNAAVDQTMIDDHNRMKQNLTDYVAEAQAERQAKTAGLRHLTLVPDPTDD